MTRLEILDAILPRNDPENAARRLKWLINLGYQMTISARADYPTVENKVEHLVAFNELQHKSVVQHRAMSLARNSRRCNPIQFGSQIEMGFFAVQVG